MNKTEIVKRVLNHEELSVVPYAINLTGRGYEIYGKRLLEQYGNEKIKKDYERGIFFIGASCFIVHRKLHAVCYTSMVGLV